MRRISWSHAAVNLDKIRSIGIWPIRRTESRSLKIGKLTLRSPDEETNADSASTARDRVKVRGFKRKETDMGKMEFPILSGWPTRGWDGSIRMEAKICAACHTRHQFASRWREDLIPARNVTRDRMFLPMEYTKSANTATFILRSQGMGLQRGSLEGR